MPVTVRGTDILFNDATTQSTAFSSAAVLTAYSATTAGVVGAVAVRTVTGGLTAPWAANSTVAGSSVYSGATGTWRAIQTPVITGSQPCVCFGYFYFWTGVYVRIS
jgi:hypothetical protein